jgi:hypothetical protein
MLLTVQIEHIHAQKRSEAGLGVMSIDVYFIHSRTLLPVPEDPVAWKSAYRDPIPLSDSSPHMCALTSNANPRKPSCCSSAM